MKILLVFAILFLSFTTAVWAQAEEKHEVVVNRINEEKDTEVSPGVFQPYQQIEGEIVDEESAGRKILVELGGIFTSNESQKMKPGDRIIVSHIKKITGEDQYFFLDFIRSKSLLILTLAFVVAVVVVGRYRGFFSFIGLIISFLILLKYIIPRIVAGADPIRVALIGSGAILLSTLFLAHGISKKTAAAILGTFASLTITALLAGFFVQFTRLTGLGSEDASMLSMFPNVNVNLQGILLAGIIIGALGVLDDITVSQAACVFELHSANKNLSPIELYRRGLKIGQDHIASLVNTLVLAYAGASLPLLLLFAVSGGEPMGILLNRELIATEIVRTLVGSLGLVSAVPITTALAAGLTRTRI